MSRKEAYIRRCISISILVVLIGCIIAICTSKAPAKEVVPRRTYMVKQGDTLWDIAQTFAPSSMDIREYIVLLQDHNNITASIRPGDIIEIVAKEKTAH